MKPFFSIIIPCYNVAETIEDCLQSVLDQSFGDYEVILTDDGSEDEGMEIAKSLLSAQLSPNRFHIISQSNQGLGAARNAAIAQAEGHYCCLLDADDLWREDKLAQCAEFLRKSKETQVLYHPMYILKGKTEEQRAVYQLKSIPELLTAGCPLIPSASIIATSLIQKEKFSEDRDFHGAEDLHLWLRLLHQKVVFHLWPEALGYYREEGGMSSRLNEHLSHVKNVLEYFYRQGYYNRTLFEKAMQRKFYEAGRWCHKRGFHSAANRYYSAADSKSVKILGLRFLNLLGFDF
jgi:glycosyltransferase involved in cell wall biosynthesis